MHLDDYNSIKIIKFSAHITLDELRDCVNMMEKWSQDDINYAVVTIIPKGGKSVQDLTSIRDIFKALKGSKLAIYGIKTGVIASFLAKVIGQILGLKMNESASYEELIEQIAKDDPNFARDVALHNLNESEWWTEH